MKALSQGYADALKRPVQQRVKLFTLTLINGTSYYLANSRDHVDYDGKRFLASPGVTLSAVRNALEAATQTATATVIYSPDGITLEMVKRGALEGATFEAIQIHADNPGLGSKFLFGGYVDDIDHAEMYVDINLVGYSSRQGAGLIGEVYSERCRNVFGDARCKYPIDTVAEEFTVTNNGSSAQAFVVAGPAAHEPGYWNFATVKWTTGANAGRVYDVGNYGAELAIGNALAYPIAVGDTGVLRPGCSKYRSECVGRWDNLINFRGEPDVPNLTAGVDSSPQDQPVREQYVTDSNGNLVHFRPGGITPAKYDPGTWPATNEQNNPPQFSS